jgi:fibrillarin-like rRNA methylase
VVRTRSIDTRARPEEVEGDVLAAIRPHYTILDSTRLLPYHRDHVAFICKG